MPHAGSQVLTIQGRDAAKVSGNPIPTQQEVPKSVLTSKVIINRANQITLNGNLTSKALQCTQSGQ